MERVEKLKAPTYVRVIANNIARGFGRLELKRIARIWFNKELLVLVREAGAIRVWISDSTPVFNKAVSLFAKVVKGR